MEPRSGREDPLLEPRPMKFRGHFFRLLPHPFYGTCPQKPVAGHLVTRLHYGRPPVGDLMFDQLRTYDPSEDPADYLLDPAPAPLEDLWHEVFRDDSMDFHARYPHRVIAGWRAVRCIASAIGRLAKDDRIGSIVDPDTACGLGRNKHGRQRVYHASIRNHYRMHHGALGLIPPAPEDHYLLADYLAVLHLAFDALNIWASAAGRLAAPHLLSPEYAHEAFPSWEDLEAFEDHLVSQALEQYASKGERATRDYLQEVYVLAPDEVTMVLLLVRDEAMRRTTFDVDTHKALAIIRLGDVIVRAQEACSLTAEIRAIKELHLVVGLGKLSPEDSLKTFADAISEIATEQRNKTASIPHDPLKEPLYLEATPVRVIEE